MNIKKMFLLLISIVIHTSLYAQGQPASPLLLERQISIDAAFIHLPLMDRDEARKKIYKDLP